MSNIDVNADRTKKVFLAHLKTQLLSPVEAIVGYSEIVEEDCAEQKDFAFTDDTQNMVIASHSLLAFVNNLLAHPSITTELNSLPTTEELAESSHQIRTILSHIIGWSEMLSEDIEERYPTHIGKSLVHV